MTCRVLPPLRHHEQARPQAVALVKRLYVLAVCSLNHISFAAGNNQVARASLVAGILSLISAPVVADDHRFGGAVRMASDYAYRGYTRSDNDWTAQANVDYEHSSGFFGGVWVSRVDFTRMDIQHEAYEDRRRVAGIQGPEEDFKPDERAELEFTPYFGWNAALKDDWRLNQTITGYIYDGQVLGANYNYYELYTQLHYRDVLSGRVGVAPYAYGYSKWGVNLELQARYPLSDVVEVWGSVGYDTVTAVPGYSQLYWSAGVKWYLQKHLAIDLRYVDAAAFPDETNSFMPPQPIQPNPIVASISIGF